MDGWMDGWMDGLIYALSDIEVRVAHANGSSIRRFSVSLIVDVDSIKLSSFSNSRVAGGIFGYTK